MNAENFCYWLQGYFEIPKKTPTKIDAKEVIEIKNHLKLAKTYVPKVGGIQPMKDSDGNYFYC